MQRRLIIGVLHLLRIVHLWKFLEYFQSEFLKHLYLSSSEVEYKFNAKILYIYKQTWGDDNSMFELQLQGLFNCSLGNGTRLLYLFFN